MKHLQESPEELMRSLKARLSSVVKELHSVESRYVDLRLKRNTLEATISIMSENSQESTD